MATITKREIAIQVTDELGAKGIEITQKDVFEVLQTIINEITNRLAEGDTVVMRNFGMFQVREMKAKVGRNPKHPEKTIPIPDRARVVFRAGKELKEKVDKTLDIIQQRRL